MTTIVSLTPKERRALLLEAMEFRLRYLLGRLLLPFENVLKSERFKLLFNRVRRFDAILAQSDYDRLPPELLKELLKIQKDQVDLSAEHRAKRYLVDGQTIQSTSNDYAFAAREAVKLLDRFPALRTIANIGARVDVISNYLSTKYPERSFKSIDLQGNLSEHNRFFAKRPNWEFKSGYIIDILEGGEPAPDLAIMTFTSCKFAKREFERFIRLSKDLKAILILATYKPNPDSLVKFRLERPEQLLDSYVTSPTLLDPNIPSYVFVHNYAKILSDQGFRIENFIIRKSPSPILQGASVFVTALRQVS